MFSNLESITQIEIQQIGPKTCFLLNFRVQQRRPQAKKFSRLARNSRFCWIFKCSNPVHRPSNSADWTKIPVSAELSVEIVTRFALAMTGAWRRSRWSLIICNDYIRAGRAKALLWSDPLSSSFWESPHSSFFFLNCNTGYRGRASDLTVPGLGHSVIRGLVTYRSMVRREFCWSPSVNQNI